MARPERFELPTDWFEASYSIQLSYGRKNRYVELNYIRIYKLANIGKKLPGWNR